MTKRDKESRLVADRLKKFEKTAHEIHQMAEQLHKKMEKLHLEALATRDRARSARQNEQAESKGTRNLQGVKRRKVS